MGFGFLGLLHLQSVDLGQQVLETNLIILAPDRNPLRFGDGFSRLLDEGPVALGLRMTALLDGHVEGLLIIRNAAPVRTQTLVGRGRMRPVADTCLRALFGCGNFGLRCHATSGVGVRLRH